MTYNGFLGTVEEDLRELQNCTKTLQKLDVGSGEEKKITVQISKMRRIFERDYRLLSDTEFLRSVSPEGMTEDSGAVNDLLRDEGAEAFYDGKRIFLRLNLLPKTRKTLSRGDYVIAPDISSFGVRSVQILMKNMLLGDGPDRPDRDEFLNKTILFLHSFQARRGRNIPDSTSHYTEKLQNELVAFLPGGDGGERFRVGHDNQLCDDIPEGTYITLSPYDRGFPTNGEVTVAWMKHYCLAPFRPL